MRRSAVGGRNDVAIPLPQRRNASKRRVEDVAEYRPPTADRRR
jgi:hypothetical protein